MKQKLIERNRDKSTNIPGHLNTPLSIVGRWKISKDREDLNNTINQLDQMTFIKHTTKRSRIHIQVHMEYSSR